ncbi:MAG: hypothetical protein ACLR0U_07335 [Enterocloster clostridioformis]
MVAPEDEKDEADLEETILRIGEGMANPALVHTFTGKIMGSLEYLEHLGVPLREAKANKERNLSRALIIKTGFGRELKSLEALK